MSLDVSLIGKEVPCPNCSPCYNCDGKRVVNEDYAGFNITHNLTKMAEEAQLYESLWRPEEIGIEFAHQLIPSLKKGLAVLLSNQEHFEKFNSPNGWGNYDGFVAFVSRYLEACERNPTAKIRVSR